MKLFFFSALILILSAGPRATAQSAATNFDSSTTSGNPVVARGKGFEIRRSSVEQVLATAKAQNPQEELPPDAEVRALTHLIEIQLVLQKATDAEKEDGKEKTDASFTNIVRTLGEPEFERRLKATHMTADDLRLMLFQEETAQASLTRQLGIKVTDADAKKFFDDHPGAYDQPPMARVREIVLLTTSNFTTSAAPPLPAATIQAKHQQILDLYKRVRAGEDFAALAKQYNEDPLSKGAGGELTFRKDEMEFGDLAFSMKTNQISNVLTNEEGYRIFQLLEIIPAQKMELTAIADRLKKMLVGKQKRTLAPAYIQQLRKEASVEILDPGLKAAVEANEAEMAANAKKAEEAQAAAIAEANSPAQKAVEAKAFGAATNQPPAKP